jgi:ABC-type glycerol-3-phosphate transport system substrate-binding protein
MRLKREVKVPISFLFLFSILVSFLLVNTGFASSSETLKTSNLGNIEEEEVSDLLDIVHNIISYEQYMMLHADAKYPLVEVETFGGDYLEASDGFEKLEGFNGVKNSVIKTGEEGSVIWEVDVPEEGFYNLLFEYYPIDGKNSTIEREIYINGEIPFDGAQYIEFYRIWKSVNDIFTDSRNNDIRPKQVESPDWIRAYAMDSEGYHTKPYSFYFNKGKNTIELVSIKEPVVIGKIILTQEEKIITYEEYKQNNKDKGYQLADLDEPIKVQGEDAKLKSNSTLYPISDRTSPATEPYHTSKIRLNAIGGANWELSGQWITWEVEVPQNGLYEIAFKYRQNIKSGLTVTRALKIDGKTPFKEANECRFYYKNDWQIASLGNEKHAYEFYLTEGKHTITFQVTLGDELSEILRKADDSILNLNKAYRQMLMVIGSSPDSMRDYMLEKKTPQAIKLLEEQYKVVKSLSEQVETYSKGSKGSELAVLDKLINQLYTMHTKPETIAKQWVAFKDNISALGSWSLSMKEQPLEIDYLLIQQPGDKLPKATAGFLAKVWHEIQSFYASFFEDYDSIGEVYEGEAIDVWILATGGAVTSTTGSGRDQAQVIKDLVDNYFVPESNIPVNVKLVNADVLLSATLAGRGPDVALNVAGKEPVNFALRNAVADLTQFEDFEEVANYFYPDTLASFTLEDGVYALPQTMSFHVMFYRADILNELGLNIPNTWDDFYECLSVIQKNNMNVGIMPDYTTFAMFLYQHGGEYYMNEGKTSGLSSEAAVQAFKQWSTNYTNYKLPVKFEFANRFRTGEMPLAIGDYTNYNYLSVFAPEIKGLWGFTTVPGYVDENENIDKSVSAWVTASIIMETSDQKESSWEFLKWWMGEEAQTNYGNEIENILGVAGRVATANMAALEKLPWSNRDYEQLKKQLKWVKALPEVPGGYFTERHITNAFYTVFNNNEDPRETLEDYVKTINYEITNKRKEFGLSIDK